MFSWSWRSTNTVICCIQLVLILLHCLHWWCAVKHKSKYYLNIWGSHGSAAEDQLLVVCYTMSLVKLLTFWRHYDAPKRCRIFGGVVHPCTALQPLLGSGLPQTARPFFVSPARLLHTLTLRPVDNVLPSCSWFSYWSSVVQFPIKNLLLEGILSPSILMMWPTRRSPLILISSTIFIPL
jgi:hypothetical protein